MNKTSNVLWGIVFIILGIVFGLNALEITDIDIFFDGWWTLFIIVPCFIDLFKEKEKMGNIIGLFIGIFLLLACRDILDFTLIWKLLIPTIFILIGLSFILKDRKVNLKKNKANTKAKEYYATFSNQTVSFKDEKLKNCDLNAIFGSLKCDLKEAIITDESVITISAIFGNVTIYVPENIEVKVSSTSIFGGVSKKSLSKDDVKGTLYIQTTCMFGGVDIK